MSRLPSHSSQGASREGRVRATMPDLYAGMNKLEKSFAIGLEAKKRNGEILRWDYERVTLKLAHDTRYTPDFFVVERDGTISFYETKGFFRDDAKVKLKVAAASFPFKFYLVEKDLVPKEIAA